VTHVPHITASATITMANCPLCDDCGWVCENHLSRPWEGEHACPCGGAGMPCPYCNMSDELSPPLLPEGFDVDVGSDD
jgi:hypothetical protein